ncbi:MFS transporter [Neorhizobium lilium]|uniref:MFS transporter n=1 Tax=Neorhizobium lilium TaxID=2503024 RepID=A0A444LIN2_9HYPH|nr:MFS transporter [Neorhizobium lilium]RWX78893.1 MFS transporter [Neorhizobium lilium]
MQEKLGRNYWALLSANAVSNLGDGIGTVAWPWIASLMTRDPVAIALVAVAFRLPWLLFSLPAGVITDRFDRRRLVIAMDAFRCGMLLALGLAVFLTTPIEASVGGSPPTASLYWFLLGSALVVGFAEVLRDNAAQTLMPAIVPPSRLEAANGRLWSVEVLGNSLIGPPLAGILLALALPLSFFANGAGFAASAIMIYSIRGSFTPAKVDKRQHWAVEMRDGARFLWRNTLLRDMALGLGVLNAMDFMMRAALVLYAQEVLQLSSAEFGLLLTAGAVGGIAGGLCSGIVVKQVGSGGALRLTLAAICLQLAVIAVWANAAPVFVVLVIGEFMGMIWNTVTVSLRQRQVPGHMLGRVNSVYRFFGWGTIPIGIAFSGIIVNASESSLGREAALGMPFAVGAVAMAVVTVLLWRRLSDRALNNAAFE